MTYDKQMTVIQIGNNLEFVHAGRKVAAYLFSLIFHFIIPQELDVDGNNYHVDAIQLPFLAHNLGVTDSN